MHACDLCMRDGMILTGSPLESEGNDRSDINLPGNQLQLLQDAAGAASSMYMFLEYGAL